MTEATTTSPENTAPGAAAVMGALLRQAREQKGYSLGEVAERLKLPARQIEALEHGDYRGLPEPVFIKGFLRSYARLLDVDETTVEEQIQTIFPPVTNHAASGNAYAMDTKPKSKLDYRDTPIRKPLPKWVFGLVLLATMGAAIYAWQNKSTAENIRQTESASQVSIGQVAMPNVDANNVSVVPMNSSEAASSLAGSGVAAPAQASAAAAGGQELLITVRYRSLLHVVNSQGETLISQIVPAGSEHRFGSGAPYQVRIGYASGARVSLGGVDVPLQGHINNKTADLTVGGNNE